VIRFTRSVRIVLHCCTHLGIFQESEPVGCICESTMHLFRQALSQAEIPEIVTAADAPVHVLVPRTAGAGTLARAVTQAQAVSA
jgi:hypothetical protein